MGAPVFNATAARVGVVDALRPKNGTKMPLRLAS